MSENSFMQSIYILINKPHVLNKRSWGGKILWKYKGKAIPQSKWMKVKLKSTNNTEDFLNYLVSEYLLEINSGSNNLHEAILMEIFPKSYGEPHAFQLIIIDERNREAMFHDVTPEEYNQNICPDFSYSLKQVNKKIILMTNADESSKTMVWLRDSVAPQIEKWIHECENKENKQQLCTESLALISKEEYYILYNELKLKYGKEMVKIWPECTDPSKFVYEDIAIATYLLILWKGSKNSNVPKTFVDIGCGNGLLVYILTMEGHDGIGVDVRKRKIWDMYPSNIKLKVKTITPNSVYNFPTADWIIGNHSDELTPWIPVIAAMSSYKGNFFLLPCCAYNFNGTKYQRQNSSKSQYTEYLDYIKSICEQCGFTTDIDRLKIPSTKRICLVGKQRMYSEGEYDAYCQRIRDLINSHVNYTNDNSLKHEPQNLISADFKTREPVEKVRNCTQIDKNIIEVIIETITNYLLDECTSGDNWSIGKSVDLNEVVKLISQDTLKMLKSNCGGLQTVLKNNHHIFKVQYGKVQLRYPKTIEEVNKDMNKKKMNSIKLQVKNCWFFHNHPQGCPLTESSCSFLHVNNT